MIHAKHGGCKRGEIERIRKSAEKRKKSDGLVNSDTWRWGVEDGVQDANVWEESGAM